MLINQQKGLNNYSSTYRDWRLIYMHFQSRSNQVLTRNIYKVCDGEVTKIIVGEYSPKSTWQPEDIIRVVIED